MASFYGRVATVNRMFREGGAAEIPGWRTDRGRIYLKYGPPSAVLSRPQPASANPYEVWRYEKQRLLKFVFLDLTRFGNYALIWTDDRFEASRPDWYLLLGPEAVRCDALLKPTARQSHLADSAATPRSPTPPSPPPHARLVKRRAEAQHGRRADAHLGATNPVTRMPRDCASELPRPRRPRASGKQPMIH
jgi:hypothetical protein